MFVWVIEDFAALIVCPPLGPCLFHSCHCLELILILIFSVVASAKCSQCCCFVCLIVLFACYLLIADVFDRCWILWGWFGG